MDFFMIWAVAIALHFLYKAVHKAKVKKYEEEYVEEEKEELIQKYDSQLKYINHKLMSLYERRKEWQMYDGLGIRDVKGNKCKKEDCIEYLKIENDIEILENKKRKLSFKCN